MSIGASLLRGVYRLSGVKKAFALPEEQLLKAIEKANRGRGFFMPTDHKAHYEKRMVNGFPCLIVRAESKPSQRAMGLWHRFIMDTITRPLNPAGLRVFSKNDMFSLLILG